MAKTTTGALSDSKAPQPAHPSSVKSVIVYGPQGSGKTLHAEELRKGFKLDRVDEEGLGGRFEPTGVLYLTNAVPAHFIGHRRVFSLKEALAQARRSK